MRLVLRKNLKMKNRLLIILFTVLFIVCGCSKKADDEAIEPEAIEDETLVLGDERFDEYLPYLKDKRVALFTNQTGIVGNVVYGLGDSNDLIPFGYDSNGNALEYGEHILDALLDRGVDVTCVFSPEHGFRGTGDAGANIDDSIDEKTGVPILSLYAEGSNYPALEDMDRFDTLVVDMQDVGLRYYTYYISMYYLMDACAQNNKTVVILDRPNPNGFYVDGPILKEEYHSNVGILPIPVVYGMTWGELATMINKEDWLEAGKDSCDLIIIPCKNYTHQTKTDLIVRPSPNLKDMRAVYLYSSTCFFENTLVTVGRGTDYPFEIYGSPYLEGVEENEYTFIPVSMDGATSPVFEDEVCYGVNLRDIPIEEIWNNQINLEYIINAYKQIHEKYPDKDFFGTPDDRGYYWIDYLSGSDSLRKMIIDGKSASEIKETWQDDIESFKALRSKYLLYSE